MYWIDRGVLSHFVSQPDPFPVVAGQTTVEAWRPLLFFRVKLKTIQ
jgi:hypothetical protein